MKSSAEYIPYSQTNSFSTIVNDYINQSPQLQPFYTAPPTINNIINAVATKTFTQTNRIKLVSAFTNAYLNVAITTAVQQNIEALLQPNTYTICTAHQPNIFTGHLYFIYKIVHAIALANELNNATNTYKFVPIYYMGNEDADLEELGELNLPTETLHWATNQTGAVGRMVIDDNFLQLIKRIEGEFGTLNYCNEIVTLIKNCYTINTTIEAATFALVHQLFGSYGLLILNADNATLKATMHTVFSNDLLHNTSYKIVQKTNEKLAQFYKVQASGREINLFYLKNNIRERIEKNANGNYIVVGTNLTFTQSEMLTELQNNPQHFSPNVILRGLYQETILPNAAFIGGGGELAYWLQLKDLFVQYQIQFPILVLRNSFVLLTGKQHNSWHNLGFSTTQLFEPTINLHNIFTQLHTTNTLTTTTEQLTITALYDQLSNTAATIDVTLTKHIQSLKTKQLNKLKQVDKKLLRAEKRNMTTALHKINTVKNKLFPNNNLQERYDNIIPYYALYGKQIIDIIYQHSIVTDSKFCVLTINDDDNTN